MIRNKFLRVISFFAISAIAVGAEVSAQEKLTVSYNSVDAPSANWYIAQEKGLYIKYGLDVESIFIEASSTNVAVLVAGQQIRQRTGGTIASAAASGANLVAVACFMNMLPYELIVRNRSKRRNNSRVKASASAA